MIILCAVLFGILCFIASVVVILSFTDCELEVFLVSVVVALCSFMASGSLIDTNNELVRNQEQNIQYGKDFQQLASKYQANQRIISLTEDRAEAAEGQIAEYQVKLSQATSEAKQLERAVEDAQQELAIAQSDLKAAGLVIEVTNNQRVALKEASEGLQISLNQCNVDYAKLNAEAMNNTRKLNEISEIVSK